jgi:hypothetical protein
MNSARANRLKTQFAQTPNQDHEPFTFEWGTVRASLGSQGVTSP